MNYYDELGLSPNASAEEVKEAYRTMMRLLHPDLQQDPGLQRAAEVQVKKLNRIYAILSDPERRRRYDDQLAGEYERTTPIIIHAPPAPVRTPFLKRSSVAWGSAVTAFLLLLVWMATRDVPVSTSYSSGASVVEPAPLKTPPVVRTPSAPASRPAAGTSSSEADRLRLNLARALDERDAALAEAEKLRSKPAPVRFERPAPAAPEKAETRPNVPEPAPVEVHAPPAPVIVAKAEPPPPAPAPVVVRNPVAGTWFYRPPATPSKNKEMYPPEFIETSITEDHGELRGTYRARYHIPDRPIAPDVNFQFAGAFSGDSGSFPWSGSGGARGQLTLKLMADHSLRIDWVASQLGALGFYKGTAVLVKRAD
jgi:hypothetical protein